MNFISYSFVALYLVALTLRWGLPLVFTRSREYDITVHCISLLGLSWLFYAWHVPWYMFLILTSTVVNYGAARNIDRAQTSSINHRRATLAIAVIINLGLLGYFKYAGFLMSSVNQIAGSGFSVPDIILPIGISFFTFQAMSYTIDVYRGTIKAEQSFLKVACYIAFFPQLVAGPIVRASDLLYQFSRRRHFHIKVFLSGGYLVLRGLFLKMVVADNLGSIIDQHWALASQEGQGALALALLVFFACQLFCDFAGYVDIARGVAYQLGFRLPLNFNAPYIATSFSDFWRRWHITLSQWMRDYLYITLGGSRGGAGRVYFNLLLVMFVSGLWHGANWTFALWGGMLGAGLVIERGLRMNQTHRHKFMTGMWFLVVQLTWIFSMALFRAADIDEGLAIMTVAFDGLVSLPLGGLDYSGTKGMIVLGWWFTLPVWLLHGRALLAERSRLGPASVHERSLYAGIMLATLLVIYNSSQQFIYFQF
ncbi:MAG: MBOAT family protein [Halieaceae bacterium]|jgi:alginate O-acetyltransferase complex protein AlgI|nr:MBOAT family protein [Halieaceae bacterium]